MLCPKEMFARIYRQNMLLGPLCSSEQSRRAFAEYEAALHRLRAAVEAETGMADCKYEPIIFD